MSNFPSSPVAGTDYLVNGTTFTYRVTGGVGEFVAKPNVVTNLFRVESIATLRTTVYVPNMKGVLVPGASAFGLGGSWFVWDAASTVADNGATHIAVVGVTTGRWVRVYDGMLDARSFGWPGDGTALTRMRTAATNANPNPSTTTMHFALPKNSSLEVGQIKVWHGAGGDWSFGNNNNLSIGQLSMENNTTGYANTAIGYESSSLNTTGINNTAIGRSALRRNQSGADSVAIGVDALAFATAGRNTAIGRSAGDTLTSGTFNTCIGYKAMQGPVGATGVNLNYNTAIGDNALTSLAQGSNNVAIGFQAGLCEVNLGVGSNASNNVWIGTSCGRDTTTAQAIVGVGYNALVLNRSGVGHTVVGYNAGSAITASTGNTAFGYEALRDSTVGLNTAVGYLSMAGNVNYTNCSALGANTEVTGNNQIQLGNSSTTTYVYGTVLNRSDARDKADVRDTELGLDFINSLRPVDYKWDMREDYRNPGESLADVQKDGSKKRNRFHHGFIAQELPDGFGGFQDHKVNGGDDVLSVGYDEFIAPLVKAVQELTARVKELEARA
jgi:hypothetical protein